MESKCKGCYHYRPWTVRKCNVLTAPDVQGKDCFAYKTPEQAYESRKRALQRLVEKDLLWLREYYDNGIEPEEWERDYVQKISKHKD